MVISWPVTCLSVAMLGSLSDVLWRNCKIHVIVWHGIIGWWGIYMCRGNCGKFTITH